MAFLELNKDKNLRRDETPFEQQLKTYWGDWGITSQVAPLQSVLLRKPGREIDDFQWAEARFREGIDPDRFREAHQRLVDIYEANGVKVYFLEEQREDRPNAVYCRDLMFMTAEGAIISRPALPVRRGEEAAMAKTLAKLNIPIVAMVDTNADPDEIDVKIPSNDDAIRAVRLITSKMADAIIEGRQGEDEEDVTEDTFKKDDKQVDSIEDIVEAVEGDNDSDAE